MKPRVLAFWPSPKSLDGPQSYDVPYDVIQMPQYRAKQKYSPQYIVAMRRIALSTSQSKQTVQG